MKKYIAMLLALLMACSCLGVMAEEEQAAPAATTAVFDFSFNENLLSAMLQMEGDEETAAMLSMVMPVLNKLGMQVIYTETEEELSLTLNGMPLFTMGAYTDEDSVTMLSDLFPNYSLVMPLSTQQTIPEIDVTALTALMAPHVLSAQENLLPYIAPAEAGAYEFDGAAFDAKTVIKMNMYEFRVWTAQVLSSVIADEALMNLVRSMAEITGLDNAASALEEMKTAAPEEGETEGSVTLCVYTSAQNANAYYTLDLLAEESILSLQFSKIGNQLHMALLAGEDVFLSVEQMRSAAMLGSDEAVLLDITLKMEDEKTINEGKIDIYAGMYMGLSMVNTKLADGASFTLQLFLGLPGLPLMTVNGQYAPGGALTLRDTLVPAASITLDPAAMEENPDQAQLMLYQLMADLEQYGLPTVLSNAIMAMPNEISALLMMAYAPQGGIGAPAFDGVNN